MNENHIYHIYVKDKCIYHSLSENEFDNTWKMIHNFLSLVDCTDINLKDITFEKLTVNNDLFPTEPPLTVTI